MEPYQHFVEIVSSKVAIENFECGHKKGKILNLTFGAHSIMGKSSLSLFLAFDAVQRFANHDLGMIILNFFMISLLIFFKLFLSKVRKNAFSLCLIGSYK